MNLTTWDLFCLGKLWKSSSVSLRMQSCLISSIPLVKLAEKPKPLWARLYTLEMPFDQRKIDPKWPQGWCLTSALSLGWEGLTGGQWQLLGGGVPGLLRQTLWDQPHARCFSYFIANPPKNPVKKLIPLCKWFRDFSQMGDRDGPAESFDGAETWPPVCLSPRCFR